MGEEVINTITNTQAAINSAQASASAVDNILTTLSKIPLIGINYNPSQPLSAALGDVSASLDPLQKNLKDFETNLKTTQSDMDAFRSQLYILDQNINTINSNLKSAQGVIDNYRTQLTSLQTSTNRAITSLPRWITTVCWILTFFILWFMLFLSAIMLQAFSTITNKNGWIRPPVRDDLPPI
jgi:chromosome segregation ATPase